MGRKPVWNDDGLHRLIMVTLLSSASLLATTFPGIYFPIWDGVPIAYFTTAGLIIILIRLSGELKFESRKTDQEEREEIPVASRTR